MDTHNVFLPAARKVVRFLLGYTFQQTVMNCLSIVKSSQCHILPTKKRESPLLIQ